METLYGEVEDKQVTDYFGRLTNRVFKIIPMSEEECLTLESYVDSLVREVFGNSTLFLGDELFQISGTLKGLDYDNHKCLKSDVFKVLNTIDKIAKRVK